MNNYFKKILIIAAHPDDETLGCGGLIAKAISLNNDNISEERTTEEGVSTPVYAQRLLANPIVITNSSTNISTKFIINKDGYIMVSGKKFSDVFKVCHYITKKSCFAF